MDKSKQTEKTKTAYAVAYWGVADGDQTAEAAVFFSPGALDEFVADTPADGVTETYVHVIPSDTMYRVTNTPRLEIV